LWGRQRRSSRGFPKGRRWGNLPARSDRDYIERAHARYFAARVALDDLARPSDPGKPIYPQYLTSIVGEVADEDAVFTVDVGTPTLWAARYLTMNGRRTLHGSFNHGSMVNAMPLKIQWAQAKGFSLYMLRVLLNGRSGEVVELANTNLR
jgi:hypothetical protein